jgi:hypothetical protein
MTSPSVKVPVKIGTKCTISVFVRKSVTGDGSVYGGTAPRLMYAFNPSLGNLVETIGTSTNNLMKFSQNFENVFWGKINTTITTDSVSVVAPDGTFTADLAARNSTTLSAYLTGTQQTINSRTYTGTIYAKLGNISTNFGLRVVAAYPNRGDALFNLSTGTLIATANGGTNTSTSGTIISVGNGWYRCSVTTTTTSDISNTQLIFGATNLSSVNSWEGVNGVLSEAYIWGAQLVPGSSVLPYYDNGQWEPLTYTTATFSNDGVAEFYVDCDGTTGWINVDDWSVDTSVDSRANDYWGVNATYVEPDFKRGTRSYTFVK